MEYAWTREIDDIAREFNVDIHTGLTTQQVALSLQKYGKNGKPSPDPPASPPMVASIGKPAVYCAIVTDSKPYPKIYLHRYGNWCSNSSRISWW